MSARDRIIEQAVAHVLTSGTTADVAAWAIGCAMDEYVKENERRLRIEGAEAMQENGDWADADPAAVVDAATAAGKWGKP